MMVRNYYKLFLISLLILSIGCEKESSAVNPVPVEYDWWLARYSMMKKQVISGEARLVFIGDSITHGWEKAGRKVWDKYYSKMNPLNLGIWGDRTQNVIWRLQNGNYDIINPSLCVIMIGTNNINENSTDEIAAGINKIIGTIRSRTPETKILLLGIFPRGTGFNSDRVTIEKCNSLISEFQDNRKIFYMDIGKNFLNSEGFITKEIMFDYLHLTEKGYRIWAESIDNKVRELME